MSDVIYTESWWRQLIGELAASGASMPIVPSLTTCARVLYAGRELGALPSELTWILRTGEIPGEMLRRRRSAPPWSDEPLHESFAALLHDVERIIDGLQQLRDALDAAETRRVTLAAARAAGDSR